MIAEIALGVAPPADILARAGIPKKEVSRLLSDDWFKERVEQERKQLESSDDLDTYFNRLCYRLLRNKLVALGVAGKLPPSELVKATDLMRRHGSYETDMQAAARANLPVLNIVIGDKAVTISQVSSDDITNATARPVIEHIDNIQGQINSELWDGVDSE